jgi:hypothetical protein
MAGSTSLALRVVGVVAAGAAVAAAAGCGSSGSSSAPSASSAASSASSASAPAPSTSSTPASSGSTAVPPSAVASPTPSGGSAAGPAGCATRDLQAKVGISQGAAGSVYQVIDFTNISSVTCTLYGYPGVSLAGGTPVTQVDQDHVPADLPAEPDDADLPGLLDNGVCVELGEAADDRRSAGGGRERRPVSRRRAGDRELA